MKKSVAITTIVAFHAAVIGILLIQSGCSSEPNAPVSKATSSVEEINANKIETEQVEEFKQEEAKTVVLPPEGSNALRVPPTRPAWNMSDSQGEEIVPETSSKKTDDFVKPAEKKVANKTYTVQKGDTLVKISKNHKVSLNELLKINDITRSTVIRVGQVLTIPEQDPASETVPAIATAPKTEAESVETEELVVYVVQKGDYLGKIAKKHRTTVSQIMAVNNLKNHNIRVGQKLKIAKGNKAVSKKSVAPKANVKLAEGEVAHTVKSGETLGAIALKYGTSVRAIMEKNSIKDARKLRVGQTLVIVSRKPVSTSEPKPQSTPAPEKMTPLVPDKKLETETPKVEAEKSVTPVTVTPETTAPTVQVETVQVETASQQTTVAPVQSVPAIDANIPVMEL